MSTTITELEKAKVSLETSIQLLRDSIQKDSTNTEMHKALRDACIQRFEFCVELAWKVSIKNLGLDTKAPNPAIREMAQNKLIDDPQIWFEFLLARNKTSHSYDEDVAKAVYKEVERIVPELNSLVTRLKKLK